MGFMMGIKLQSRKASIVEIIISQLLGFLVALALQVLVFPCYGIYVPISTDISLVLIFTVASIIRGYIIRRLWNMEFWKRYGN